MSADEKGISPAHKTATPTHRSASSSTSSQREGRQSIHTLERTASSSTEPSVSRQLLEPEPVPLSKEADSWEIIEGLKIGQTNVQKPDKHEGFMLKKRKWPLKGWHKIQKGKVHGSIDVGLSVMSIKKKARRIDLDTEEHIYHLKVKSQDWFDAWVSKLRHHRLYRQNEIVRSPRDASFHIFPSTSTAESSPAANVSVVDGKVQSNSFPWQSPLPCSNSLPATCTTGQSKVAAWLQDSEEMDRCAEDLAHCQSNLVELSKLLQNLEILQRTQSAPNFTDMQANCVDISKKDKRVTRRWRTKSVSKDTKIQLQEGPPAKGQFSTARRRQRLAAAVATTMLRASPNTPIPNCCYWYQDIPESGFLPITELLRKPWISFPGSVKRPKSSVEGFQVPFSATMSPVRLHSSNPNLCADIEFQTPPSHLTDPLESSTDYTKLQEEFCLIAQKVHSLLKSAFNSIAIEKEKLKQMVSEQDHNKGHSTQMARLRQSLSQALNQNAELRSRLNRIHSESIICDQVVSVNIIPSPDEAGEQIHVSLPLSQQVANESRLSMSESVSEFFDAQEVLLSASSSENEASDDESYISDVSDNISEDNTSVADNISRQILNGELTGGAFRNGRRTCLPAPCPDTSNINLWNILRNNIGKDLSKVSMPVELNEPLNTLQHLCEEIEYSELLDKASETDDPYERMVLVAAFAVSGYCSTYFRAGSKPFNPVLGETYECIREDKGFRFFSEQVNYWNSNVNEVQGVVMDQEGKVVHRLFGKWHEGLYCGVAPSAKCIWRPGSMPTNYELYYGFTRFAIELNELDPVLKDLLPPTDARFRPDQRFLEEGNLEAAAAEKQRVEELQRSRRRYMEENNLEHIPKFFKKVIDANQREAWVSNDTYWELRKDPGFSKVDSPVLW
ncbi:Oxysterol-binding protein-related protein 6 [Tupaia chinensis]|uniref:Oxysterol-binding protein-related protein 6 n=1 Tax=Tupaia chinensis TaxID=246437 RepID=L9KLB1_TUPCH|nr:Oxysterol-binding protein-related protein 6 [Tupaia chinensis]